MAAGTRCKPSEKFHRHAKQAAMAKPIHLI
jgi:hypothetical protein